MLINQNTTAPELNRVIIKVPEDKPQKSNFLPVLHGKATDAISNIAGKSITENKLNNTGIIDAEGVKIVFDFAERIIKKLGVSTAKLFITSVAEFTALNHTGSKARKVNFYDINISLKEYASMCGYDVTIHEKATEKEAVAEALRAKRALDNARRKINKNLSILFSASLSWSEKVRGKQEDYMDIRIIEAKGIKNGFIKIRFSQAFSEYLIKLPITQVSAALLALDERNPNAYILAVKFTNHFNMDNNQIRGTAQLLKIKTLLKDIDLPSIEKVRAEGRRWEDRIKEPFENSLDTLTAGGILENWEYSHTKGKAMTNEEATTFSSYEEWAETLIYFILKDAPDHRTRLEAKAEEKKVIQSKIRRKPKKKTG